MENTLKKPMTGIIPPLVTPLLDNDKLDIDGLERLIERLIKGGVHGLFILGTTGEAQSISYRLRHEMIKETCRINAGRLPVLVCISDTSIVESIHLAHVGAEFYEDLIPQLPLPIFLYNMPSHTKVNFAPATIQRIARNPQVVGFKDSSANAVYFQSVMYVMKDRQDFAMLVGPEEITAECVLLGGHGGINGGANMFPELYVDLYHAAVARDMETVSRLQPLVMQISSSIYTVGQHGSSYLKGLKCALSLLGVCDDFVAAPFHRFNVPEREKIRKALEALPFCPELKP